MRVSLSEGDYKDRQPCCSTSLFAKGKRVPSSAEVMSRTGDFQYLEGFPLKWVFEGGVEASMNFVVYDSLKVGLDEPLVDLPHRDKEKFVDQIGHFPSSANLEYFAALSREYVAEEWIQYILVYRNTGDWELCHRITNTDYLRPLQFLDDSRLLLLKQNAVLSLCCRSGALEELVAANNSRYVNAHISSNPDLIGIVCVDDGDEDASGIDLFSLAHDNVVNLKFGANEIDDSAKEWLSPCTVPLRVGNGTLNLSVEIDA